MHLYRTADSQFQILSGAFERNDDVIQPQLRIGDYFLRIPHGAERDVDALEDFVPMRHRLRAEDLIENGGQLRHVLRQLCRLGEPRISQEILTADCFRHGGQLVGRDDKKEPGAVRSAIHIHSRIGGMRSVVQPEEFRLAQRGLDENACRPDTFGEERRRDIGAFAGALTTI